MCRGIRQEYSAAVQRQRMALQRSGRFRADSGKQVFHSGTECINIRCLKQQIKEIRRRPAEKFSVSHFPVQNRFHTAEYLVGTLGTIDVIDVLEVPKVDSHQSRLRPPVTAFLQKLPEICLIVSPRQPIVHGQVPQLLLRYQSLCRHTLTAEGEKKDQQQNQKNCRGAQQHNTVGQQPFPRRVSRLLTGIPVDHRLPGSI